MIKNIILLGKPGAGKGTFATALVQEFGYVHISTGNLFRNEIKNKTELGQKVATILQEGGYVSDELTNGILKKAVTHKKLENKRFVFDGYPRTINQAIFLDQIKNIAWVILLDATEKVIIDRLSSRYICVKAGHIYNYIFNKPKVAGICDLDHSKLIQRDDDKPESIIDRLKVYDEETIPLINYYQKQGKLLTFDSTKTPKALLVEFEKKVVNGSN